MTKNDCAASISTALTSASRWRLAIDLKFPDHRNTRASSAARLWLAAAARYLVVRSREGLRAGSLEALGQSCSMLATTWLDRSHRVATGASGSSWKLSHSIEKCS